MNKTLEWIYANKLPTGGIAAWPSCSAYPEVTGYLIPTLYDYGADDLAKRCAEWLLTIQQPDGSYLGMDGLPYTFDTAAVIQGLERAAHETGQEVYLNAAAKARAWITTKRTQWGTYTVRDGLGAPQHNIRVNGIMQDNHGAYHISGNDRTHFIAYAMEGFLSLGYRDEVKGTLEAMPYRPDGIAFFSLGNWQGSGSDVIATCQLAILAHRVGLDATKQVDAVRRCVKPNGGIPQALDIPREMSWGAKFYLDMLREVEQ